MRRVVMIVVALVILGGIGYGGYTLGMQRGETSAKATAASDRSAFQASRGSAAAGGGQGAGAGGNFGGGQGGNGGAASGGQGGNGGAAGGGQGGAGRGGQGGTPGAAGSAGAGTRMPATSGSPGATRTGGPNGVMGRVTMVSGQTFAVQSSMDNTNVNVTTGGDTIFTKLVAGSTSDLKLNDFVTVQGTMSGDNAYTATAIRGSSAQQVAAVANAGITGMGAGMGAGMGNGTPGAMTGRGGGMGMMGGRGAMGGAAVVGRITQLDVNSLTVATTDGTMVTVNTTPSTSIQTTKSASIGDIQAGDTVVVLGDRTGESVTARLVTDEGQG